MSVVQPNFNFSIKATDDHIEIDVVPPPATKTRLYLALLNAMLGLILGLIGGLIVFAGLMSGFLPRFLVTVLVLGSTFGAAAYLYLQVTNTIDARLLPAKIKVNRDGITLNGQTYLRSQITQIFVEGPPGQAIVDVTPQRSVSGEISRMMNQSFSERAFAVKMTYAAERITLVDALPQPTADAVYREVSASFAKFA